MSTQTTDRNAQELLEVLEEIEYFAEQSYRRIMRRITEVREILSRGGLVLPAERPLPPRGPYVVPQRATRRRGLPAGEPGLLTSTETAVLNLLRGNPEGRTAPVVAKTLGKTREHTARLLKKMCDEGLIVRREDSWPFVYTLLRQIDGNDELGGSDTSHVTNHTSQ